MAADDARALPADLPPQLLQMDPEMFRRRFGRAWTFEVVDAYDVNPRMRRVVYTAPDLEELSYKPGQEIIMLLPGEDGPERRHYTIRSLDRAAGRLDVDFVLHGDSPAGRYCRAAKAGDKLTVLGPRGRHVLKDGADWRLFIGDETAIPAIFGMLETLPQGAPATALIEISGDVDKQALKSEGDVKLVWLARDAPAGQSDVLAKAVEELQLPAGTGHVYTLGETAIIRRIRQGLIARGVPKEAISAEGYWRPGRIGGHEHVDD
jgi:NADPH-dependent ferric siderophore reductase